MGLVNSLTSLARSLKPMFNTENTTQQNVVTTATPTVSPAVTNTAAPSVPRNVSPSVTKSATAQPVNDTVTQPAVNGLVTAAKNTVMQSPTTPANVASVAAPPTPVTRTIASSERVSDQLNSLLKQEGTYIQSARNRGIEQANSRGLINSSLAAGTAERAAIDAAAPIAAQDASTYANAALAAQNAGYDQQLTGYKSLLDSAQTRENFGYTTATNEQNIKANIALAKDQQAATKDLQTQSEKSALARQTQAEASSAALKQVDVTLKQMGIDFDTTKLTLEENDAFASAFAPIQQQTQAEIAKIQMTPNSVMNADAKELAIQNMYDSEKAKFETMASIYGLNIQWSQPTFTNPVEFKGQQQAALPPEQREAAVAAQTESQRLVDLYPENFKDPENPTAQELKWAKNQDDLQRRQPGIDYGNLSA